MIASSLAGRLRRHRRLLALCGLSALVHLALLEWLASPGAAAPPPARGRVAADDLVLRLLPADAPRRADARPARADSGVPPPRPQAVPAPAPAPATPAATAPAASPVQTRAPAADAAAIPAAAAAPAGQPQPDTTADAAPLVQMPPRYRVRMPDAVLLTYTRVRQAAAQATPQPLPDARIDWRSDGERYLLTMDGVLGRLSSRGASADAGVRPRSAAEDGADGRLVTEFADGEVRFGADGRSVPDSTGIQDRASLLMQLAGIGLGEPDQIEGQVRLQGALEVVVAGSREAAIERYRVIGLETLATPLGAIESWHLAQQAAPGRARLEVWLAPGRGWLPVQLRLTAPDGAAATQTIRAIAPQPAGLPADVPAAVPPA